MKKTMIKGIVTVLLVVGIIASVGATTNPVSAKTGTVTTYGWELGGAH